MLAAPLLFVLELFAIAELVDTESLAPEPKAGIAEVKRLVLEGKWEEAMALAGQKKARGASQLPFAGGGAVPAPTPAVGGPKF